MSTIVRSSSDSRSGREGRGSAGVGGADGPAGADGVDGPVGAGGVGGPDRGVHRVTNGVKHGRRESRRPLTGRALRVRNACVRRAAAQLGLPMPNDAELLEIPEGASLRQAVDWWKARAPGAVEPEASVARVGLVMRMAVVVAVTLVGLAFSYGQVQ